MPRLARQALAFLRFLRQVTAAYPERDLHVVLDNYATHQHPKVKQWLARNPRVTLHLTPTSCSWRNLGSGPSQLDRPLTASGNVQRRGVQHILEQAGHLSVIAQLDCLRAGAFGGIGPGGMIARLTRGDRRSAQRPRRQLLHCTGGTAGSRFCRRGSGMPSYTA